MLANPNIAKLDALGLSAMAASVADQLERPGPWDDSEVLEHNMPPQGVTLHWESVLAVPCLRARGVMAGA